MNSRTNYSNFWFDRQTSLVDDFLADDDVVEEKVKPQKDHIQLAANQRAVGNFVRIVSGQNIPVRYMTRGDSYTDGKSVTIAGNIKPETFDQTVGLALHEGSHIAYTDFQASYDAFDTIYSSESFERRDFFKNMVNYVEDRRIDNIVFKSSPGYKGYYHTLYKKYFNHKTISKGLTSAMYREIDLDSYMFRIINFTNDATDLTALPKLEEIYNLIDLKNISRLKSTGGAIEVARQVCEIVFPMIDKVTVEEEEGNGEGSEDQDGEQQDTDSKAGGASGDGSDDQDTDTNDTQPDTSSLPQLNPKVKKQIENLLNKEKDLLNGKTPKSKLTKGDADMVNNVSRSGAELKDVEMKGTYNTSKTKVILVPKLTQELIDNHVFNFCNKWAQTHDRTIGPINEGLRLGTILGKKLKVRGEERDLIHTRQKSGKIDKRLISELGFDNSSVFSHKFTERFNKANLHISVDGSGSMNGRKWDRAITSTVAMCKAAEMAGNIRVIVSFRFTQGDKPLVLIGYDSKINKLNHIKSLWTGIGVSGTTPESLCYEAMMDDYLKSVSGDDNYFINFSDGQPFYSSGDIYYYGSDAERHCKKQVKIMKNRGIKILSYFVSEYAYDSERSSFKSMYGNDASFIKPTNMMEVAKTMNAMFLQK
tara:strand:+ start:485 stop:2425 length:1941 start_codon:yes stop_codon:yes gene_type:complete